MIRTVLFSAATLGMLAASGCGSLGVTEPAKVVNGVLISPDGMTLYTYDRDTGGKSTCYGQCPQNWPPFRASSHDSDVGNWTITMRDDGSRQWAYRGKPVYLWSKDQRPGDRTGDGINGSWHVARP